MEPPHRNHELQVHLFARSGIRFMFARHPAHPGFVVRLPLALATYQDADLERIVSALTIATDLGDPAPALVPAVTDSIHPQDFGPYTLRD